MMTKDNDKIGIDRQYLKFINAYTLFREEEDYPFQWLMV